MSSPRPLAFTFLGAALSFGLTPFSPATAAPARDVPVIREIHVPRPLPSPAANDVRAVLVDSADRLWAATRAGVFQSVSMNDPWQPVTRTLTGPAFTLADDGRDTVWLGAWDGLHRIVNGEDERIAGVDGPISAVAATGETVIAGGPDGFHLIRDGQATRLDPPCTRYLQRIVAGPDETFWFATKMGVFHWRGAEGSYLPFDRDRVSADVRGVAFGGRGQVVAAALGGLQVFDGGRLREQITPANGLPSADVRSVTRDAAGRLWVGTSQGVARQDGDGWAVRRSRRWLLADDVRDLTFSRDGTAWVATAAGVSGLQPIRLDLAGQARRFHEILEARHVRPPGIVEKCRLRSPGNVATWVPMDDDNDGGYTAIALAMESYRYAATQDPAALAAARRAFGALEFLRTVTGPNGFLARTVVPADWKEVHDPNEVLTDPQWADERVRDARGKRVPVRWRPSADGRWLWKGDTSSDEMTAHFFGYFVFHELAPDAADRQRVRTQVCRLMDHLIENGFVLRDLDGQPTRWGIWSPERLNGDPNWAMERGINSLELLSFLKLAHHVSGDPKYDAQYRRLIREHHYDRNVLEAPNLNPAWRTYIDLELLAFAYPALLKLEPEPRLHGLYRRSFDRWHRAIRADANPFFEFLYATHANPGQARLADAITFLRQTPLDLVRWTVDNSPREDVRLVRRPVLEDRQTERLLPPPEIGYSRTDQNPWLAVQGEAGETESDGVFWLLPYWMGRCHGYIAAPAARP